MSFSDDLNKEIDNIRESMREITKATAVAYFDDVVRTSPVGNQDLWKNPKSAPEGYSGGRFRSNWFLTNVNPSQRKDEDITSEESKVNEITKGILADERFFSYILTNNLDYSEAIEAGHSTQAPNGVVGPATKEAERYFREAEKTVNRKRGIKR